MLYRLYKPFLWRSLGVANSIVRANAVAIMLDVFPLYDPESSKEDMDNEIQRQFDLIKVYSVDLVRGFLCRLDIEMYTYYNQYTRLLRTSIITPLMK